MRRLLVLFVVLALGGLPAAVVADPTDPAGWGALAAGPHAVGFRVFDEYDFSRTFRSQLDFRGARLRDGNPRPIQVSVWYPAEPGAEQPHLRLRDYLLLMTREVDFDSPPSDDVGPVLRRFRIERAPDDLDVATLARRDAPLLPGRFPLILYAPSLGSSSAENVVLCEYLASHGYVVAASPAVGMYDRQMVGSITDLYAQVHDLAFLAAFMRSFPGVDMERVGTLGFSWGGLSNVVLAMLNSTVKAVVSLDGSISFADHVKLARDSFLYDPDTFRVPFMLVSQSPWRYAQIRDYSFFRELEYSDVVLVYAHDLVHMHFASTFMSLFGFIPSEGNAPTTDEARILGSYHVVCRYTLQFLDAHLKGSEEAAAFLGRAPEENGIPGEVLSVTRRRAIEAPPLPDQFVELIRSEGVGTATRIFRETKALHPEYVMFQPGQLIQLSARLEAAGEIEEAAGVLELATLGAPGSYNAYDRLALFYAAHGDVDRAVRTYERFVELNPDSVFSTIAPDAIKALKDRK